MLQIRLSLALCVIGLSVLAPSSSFAMLKTGGPKKPSPLGSSSASSSNAQTFHSSTPLPSPKEWDDFSKQILSACATSRKLTTLAIIGATQEFGNIYGALSQLNSQSPLLKERVLGLLLPFQKIANATGIGIEQYRKRLIPPRFLISTPSGLTPLNLESTLGQDGKDVQGFLRETESIVTTFQKFTAVYFDLLVKSGVLPKIGNYGTLLFPGHNPNRMGVSYIRDGANQIIAFPHVGSFIDREAYALPLPYYPFAQRSSEPAHLMPVFVNGVLNLNTGLYIDINSQGLVQVDLIYGINHPQPFCKYPFGLGTLVQVPSHPLMITLRQFLSSEDLKPGKSHFFPLPSTPDEEKIAEILLLEEALKEDEEETELRESEEGAQAAASNPDEIRAQIETIQEELIDQYAAEFEEKVRQQQEQRMKWVIEGAHLSQLGSSSSQNPTSESGAQKTQKQKKKEKYRQKKKLKALAEAQRPAEASSASASAVSGSLASSEEESEKTEGSPTDSSVPEKEDPGVSREEILKKANLQFLTNKSRVKKYKLLKLIRATRKALTQAQFKTLIAQDGSHLHYHGEEKEELSLVVTHKKDRTTSGRVLNQFIDGFIKFMR